MNENRENIFQTKNEAFNTSNVTYATRELTPKIKFGGTLGTLKITFLDGAHENCVYKIPGDRNAGGKFVIYTNTIVKQIEPIEQKLSLEESYKIIDLLRPYTRYVEVR